MLFVTVTATCLGAFSELFTAQVGFSYLRCHNGTGITSCRVLLIFLPTSVPPNPLSSLKGDYCLAKK